MAAGEPYVCMYDGNCPFLQMDSGQKHVPQLQNIPLTFMPNDYVSLKAENEILKEELEEQRRNYEQQIEGLYEQLFGNYDDY